MTREEIIEQLNLAIDLIKQDGKDWLDDRDIPILEECVKALSQEPCDDAISREAVLEAIITLWADKPFGNPALTEIKECVERVPSVTQKSDKYRKEARRWKNKWLKLKKSGKWIDKDFRKEEYVLAGKCSVCGQVRVIDKFCSNCGSAMKGE